MLPKSCAEKLSLELSGHYVLHNRRVDYVADDQGFHVKSNRAKRSPIGDLMTRRMSMRMVGVSGFGRRGYMGNNMINRVASYRDNGVVGQAGYMAQMINGMPRYFNPYY